jgi:phenylpyruvate tautomerase PptA (4-oxalocrotonate tautomerase family)
VPIEIYIEVLYKYMCMYIYGGLVYIRGMEGSINDNNIQSSLSQWLQVHADTVRCVQSVLNCKNKLTYDAIKHDEEEKGRVVSEIEALVVTLFELNNSQQRLVQELENVEVQLHAAAPNSSSGSYEVNSLVELISGLTRQLKLDMAVIVIVLESIRDESWSQEDFVTLIASLKYCPYASVNEVQSLVQSL